MASTHSPFLHDNVNEGMDFTSPPHLIGMKWRHSHNMRLTPKLEQVPHKKVHATVGSADIIHIGTIPTPKPGTGTTLLFSNTAVFTSTNVSLVSGLSNDATFKRWSTTFYNGDIYYSNLNNAIRRNTGSSDAAVANAPKARYVTTWYDHLVAAYVDVNGSLYPSRLKMSDVYRFNVWDEAAGNEADHYDFVEWQSQEYPYIGITGLGKLRGQLWVYTPTAIIPLQYVGKPKVFQVVDQGVVTRVGNTFPYTLVALDTVHFFFDYIEKMFFAFDGQSIVPIGEPVRDYIIDNLHSSYDTASKMYGYVDTDKREIWWPFISSSGGGTTYDKAVVFNYRYKKWFTASVENVLCFYGGNNTVISAGELTGTAGGLTGTVINLGVGASLPKVYGSHTGRLLTDSTDADLVADLIAQDDPVLESADFHYGDIRTTKECFGVIINAYYPTGGALNSSAVVEVNVQGRDFLSENVTWVAADDKGDWTKTMQDGQLALAQAVPGRVLRYKFVGKNVRGLQFSAWSDLVRGLQAER